MFKLRVWNPKKYSP